MSTNYPRKDITVKLAPSDPTVNVTAVGPRELLHEEMDNNFRALATVTNVYVEDIDNRLIAAESDIDTLQSDVTTLQAEMLLVSPDNVANIAARIEEVDQRVANAESVLIAHEIALADLANAVANVNTFDNRITSNEQSIAALETQANNLQTELNTTQLAAHTIFDGISTYIGEALGGTTRQVPDPLNPGSTVTETFIGLEAAIDQAVQLKQDLDPESSTASLSGNVQMDVALLKIVDDLLLPQLTSTRWMLQDIKDIIDSQNPNINI